MAPKGWNSFIRAIYFPKEDILLGRIGIVHFQTPSEWSTIDLAILCVYCYVQSRPGPHGGDTRNQETLTWAMTHLQLLPSSTTVLIMTDANGHVGTTRTYAPTDAPPMGEDARHPAIYERAEDYPHIGNMGVEQENGNGMHLRRFLEQTHFLALNTWRRSWAGPTYNGNERGTIPDYILTNRSQLIYTGYRCTRLYW